MNTPNSDCSSGMESVSEKELAGTSKVMESVSDNAATSSTNTIDALLERQRNELMFELRRLQHGDRPVSGQGNKEAVEQLLQRSLGIVEETPEPEANRPEHVVVEVNALVERRPVSSMLGSTFFRRSLENALRGAVSRNRRLQPTQGRNTPPVEQVDSSSTPAVRESNVAPAQAAASEGSAPAVNASRARPVPAPRRRLIAQQPSQNRNAQNTNDLQRDRVQQANNEQNNTPREVSASLSEDTRSSFAQEWLQREQERLSQAGPPMHIWNTIEEAHREEMLADISELVHRQLVTGTLSGNFRTTLERRMQERLENSQTDGQRVREFIQSIPRTHNHVRNDFTELGIGDFAQDLQEALSHSDEMSVVSATAAVTVPYTQSNAAMSREMKSLKAQMQEMKNMMKLQFDLTMDLQRSIRQEVAAAMNQTQPHQQTGPVIHSRPVDDTHCVICLEGRVNTVLYQCGHMCVCHGCGLTLQRQEGSKCPVCRAPIKDIIRAYKCNSD